MTTLARAIEIANRAHEDQEYSDGEPYIFHVMRVVMRCKTDDERIVAALHDVVEDASREGYDLAYLRDQRFADHIIDAVQLLTHDAGVSYTQYVLRLCGNDLARRVKIADINENCSRLYLMDDETRFERLAKKYVNALKILQTFEESINNVKK